MKRVIALFLVVALSVGSLSGCANIQNDGTRTKTEGTLFGTGVGAAIGAGIGAIIGGGRGAAIGAGAGALVGGLVGLGVGTHIADQKAKYASEEEWLDACVQQARETNAKLTAHNSELKKQADSLDKETKRLNAAYAANKADKQQLLAERNKIEGTIKENAQIIAGAEAEITAQQRVLADAKASQKTRESAQLETEIADLKRQKTQLEATNKQLASMSARISV